MLTPRKNSATTGDIFIAQTDAAKEALAGKLFVLAEIESKKTECLKIINFIIDNIFINYYQNEKIILREKISTLKVEHIFESALAKTNANFAEFLKNEKIKINHNSINISIGVVHEDTLYFSNTGKNKIFLVYKQKNQAEGKSADLKNKTEINDEIYKIIDIAEKTAKNTEKQNMEKLFSNVVNGQIPPKGHFFITSEALPEYISNKQLINIISALPPASAAEQIKNILNKINVYVSFLGIIIKTTSAEDVSGQIKPTAKSTSNSVFNLNQTEEATEELLSPAGIINFKKWIKYSHFGSAKPSNSSGKTQKSLNLKDKILFKKSSSDYIIKTINFIKNIFIHIINFIFFIAKNLASKQRLTLSLKKSIYKIKRHAQATYNFFFKLSKKNKVLLFLSFIFALLFIINLLSIEEKNQKIENENNFNELTTLIEQKQNQADANLLYSNEEGALKLFNEIESLLAEFPQENNEQIEKLTEFKKKLNEQLEQIRNVIRIDDPKELANFENLNSRAEPKNIFLFSKNNQILAADANEKSIYILNLSDNLVTSLTDMEKEISSLKFPAPGLNDSIYYFNNKNIIALEAADMSMNDLSINLPSNPSGYTAADTYNGRLYLMDSENSDIFRFNRAGGAFSSAYAWLTAGINLSEAIDMSIDGNIYVLKNNGEVIKLLRGEMKEFKLENCDPVLENPTKIFVSPELEYIYILEPEKNRLVVFNKSEQFLMQYISNKFNTLLDFAVNEASKTIYFLNKTKIFSIEAQHFPE